MKSAFKVSTTKNGIGCFLLFSMQIWLNLCPRCKIERPHVVEAFKYNP